MNIDIYKDKKKYCYNKDNCWHNNYGPDVIYSDGYKSYCVNGKLHNLYGPAVIYPDDNVNYWLNGSTYTKEEWEYEVNKIK